MNRIQCQGEKMSNRKKVILGSHHQGDIRYGLNSGTQCVAMVQSFWLYSAGISVAQMGKKDIDNVLHTGNNIYTSARKRVATNYLLATELPHIIGEGIWRCRVIPSLILHGKIYGDLEELCAGLDRGFSRSETLYFTAKETCVGVTKVDAWYYLFDSHARNKNGYSDSQGTACLIRFKKFFLLAKYLFEQYGQVSGERFEIVVCSVQRLEDVFQPLAYTYVDESSYVSGMAVEEHVVSSSELLTDRREENHSVNSEEWKRVIYPRGTDRELPMVCKKGQLLFGNVYVDGQNVGGEERIIIGRGSVAASLNECEPNSSDYDKEFPPLNVPRNIESVVEGRTENLIESLNVSVEKCDSVENSCGTENVSRDGNIACSESLLSVDSQKKRTVETDISEVKQRKRRRKVNVGPVRFSSRLREKREKSIEEEGTLESDCTEETGTLESVRTEETGSVQSRKDVGCEKTTIHSGVEGSSMVEKNVTRRVGILKNRSGNVSVSNNQRGTKGEERYNLRKRSR